jgi:hypothetical protein
MSWFGNAFDAATPQSADANSLAAAFNNLTSTAGQAFNTYQTGQTQVELAKLKQGNVPVAPGAYQQPGLGLNTRSIATVALLGVGGFFLYKFAKKNKWL